MWFYACDDLGQRVNGNRWMRFKTHPWLFFDYTRFARFFMVKSIKMSPREMINRREHTHHICILAVRRHTHEGLEKDDETH